MKRIVASKCGLVEVALWLDATTVCMEVIKMPEWLRGKYGRGNPMHRWDGFSLCSDAEPGLESASVHIGGVCWKGDGRGASKACLTIGETIAYLDKARCLIETFDSTPLLKKDEKKWRIVAVEDPVLGPMSHNLYWSVRHQWELAAQALPPEKANALAAALGIEVE